MADGPATPHCTGCGRPTADCGGCAGPSDPWHYCGSCGRWLATQVTPAGWTATCRSCGTTHRATHRGAPDTHRR